MANLVVVGAQWGDEGKGKIVDLLTDHFDVIARYQGGHNAGHTVIIDGKKYILHLIPSGILHAEKICVIGNGVVVDLLALKKELEELRAAGVHCEGRPSSEQPRASDPGLPPLDGGLGRAPPRRQ